MSVLLTFDLGGSLALLGREVAIILWKASLWERELLGLTSPPLARAVAAGEERRTW